MKFRKQCCQTDMFPIEKTMFLIYLIELHGLQLKLKRRKDIKKMKYLPLVSPVEYLYCDKRVM